MTAFTLLQNDGKPQEIIDFNVNLLSSPPEINQELINRTDDYINPNETHNIYKDAVIDEGQLNIHVCKLSNGKYYLHVFGRIRGKELILEKVLSERPEASLLNEHIKYVLASSRNILKNYYVNANLQSMKNHLMAFLVPS